MQYREIGRTKIQASAIGLGTWAIGGGSWWGETDDSESIKTIQAAIDCGVTLIDTAPAYGWGHSEEIVGKAIKGRRDKVVLSTKCGLWWDDNEGTFFFEMEGYRVKRSLKPSIIKKEIEMSLKRLGVEYIDLYHTHWQSVEPDKTPIAETMEALLKLKEQGKIKSIGVSNVNVTELKEYQAVGVLDACQTRYSMLDRVIEKDILPFCRENNISVLAYSPLEQGLLSGKIGMDKQFSETEYRNQIPWFRPNNRQRVLNLLSGWKDLTEKYNCSIAQLVLAWTISQPGITIVLCGARHASQIYENAVAGSLKLDVIDINDMRWDVECLGGSEE